MTKLLLLLLAASILHSAVSFAYFSSCGDGQSTSTATALSNSKKSNSPDAMSDLSSLVQKHQEVPSPFHGWSSLGSNDFNEWQTSFGRNGLTDFLPQFSSHISCLAIDYENANNTTHSMISDAIEGNSVSGRLPWQFDVDDDTSDATTSITSVPVSASLSKIEEIESGDFDCILDSGVMNEIIGSIPSTVTWHSRNGPPALLDLVKLMSEAAQKIREFGIYVAITDQTIPDNAKGYLNSMGEIMGMEWLYDLDGLSKEGYHVSVARKYYAGPVNFDPFSYGRHKD